MVDTSDPAEGFDLVTYSEPRLAFLAFQHSIHQPTTHVLVAPDDRQHNPNRNEANSQCRCSVYRRLS